jgi:hypothetical protein
VIFWFLIWDEALTKSNLELDERQTTYQMNTQQELAKVYSVDMNMNVECKEDVMVMDLVIDGVIMLEKHEYEC